MVVVQLVGYGSFKWEVPCLIPQWISPGRASDFKCSFATLVHVQMRRPVLILETKFHIWWQSGINKSLLLQLLLFILILPNALTRPCIYPHHRNLTIFSLLFFCFWLQVLCTYIFLQNKYVSYLNKKTSNAKVFHKVSKGITTIEWLWVFLSNHYNHWQHII